MRSFLLGCVLELKKRVSLNIVFLNKAKEISPLHTLSDTFNFASLPIELIDHSSIDEIEEECRINKKYKLGPYFFK
ncbi:hypothetical protein A3Q56_01694 [Intoshia linei]|uniref:Uncharacterized protein n=1 Tax=Intoshia linei TaxID=1819745 RepID=A0A177B8F2_9BILA|nr:hypothetical protein A3Q56_01694 [Intoshia linei]